MKQTLTVLATTFILAGFGPAAPIASANPWLRPTVEVLVAGNPVPTYAARGTVYVEALKGREYEIRIRNPYPVRVAVALSVDGLNTIDARHTSAQGARKWVIEPYDTITISGWQTSMTQARRFEFTSEERSYGAWLGKTNDLGIISAVFYRERAAEHVVPIWRYEAPRSDAPAPAPAGADRPRTEGSAQADARGANEAGAKATLARQAGAPADEYAATGIGRRTEHAVREVQLELESTPAASVNLRYEYRAQLVKLGVLPPAGPSPDRLDRRERARGFDGTFCPEPRRPW
jgi:hypothetical protein